MEVSNIGAASSVGQTQTHSPVPAFKPTKHNVTMRFAWGLGKEGFVDAAFNVEALLIRATTLTILQF